MIYVNSVMNSGRLVRASVPDVIENIRARIAQCRPLADMIPDRETAALLRQMADDGERDVRRLETARREREERDR